MESKKLLVKDYILDYFIGDTVYLITDSEQLERIVIGINLRPQYAVTYNIVCGTVESWHYAIELSSEIDIQKK